MSILYGIMGFIIGFFVFNFSLYILLVALGPAFGENYKIYMLRLKPWLGFLNIVFAAFSGWALSHFAS